MVHGACAVMRVSVVPGELMLAIGEDTLTVSEARFDSKNNIGHVPGAGDFSKEECCERFVLDT